MFLLIAGCQIFLEENLANGGYHLLGGGQYILFLLGIAASLILQALMGEHTQPYPPMIEPGIVRCNNRRLG